MKNKPNLVWYAARYWYWYGQRDHRGEMCLLSLRRDGGGTVTEQRRFRRVVEGDEYTEQMEAIEYFRQLGVAR